MRNGKADEALKNLEEAEQIYPEFPAESIEFYNSARESLQKGDPKAALTSILIFHNFLKLTPEYQGGINELKGNQANTLGIPVISSRGNTSIKLFEGESIIDVMRFTDATVGAGLDAFVSDESQEEYTTSFAIGDMDGDGDQDLYFSGYAKNGDESFHHLLKSEFGRFSDITKGSGIKHNGQDRNSLFADYDNDGFLDLYVSNSASDILYRNVSEGKFKDRTSASAIGSSSYKPLFVDLDHEGDLDIFLASEGRNTVLRNNGDGTFQANADFLALVADDYNSKDLAFGDFDQDGDVDIVVANTNGPVQLFSNLRQSSFKESAQSIGVDFTTGSVAVEVADLNNDGLLDILVAGLKSEFGIFINNGDGIFKKSNLLQVAEDLITGTIHDIGVFDFDNDGYSDLMIAGQPDDTQTSGLLLLHNTSNGFEDVSFLLPAQISGARQ
jgi:hypothetical protein